MFQLLPEYPSPACVMPFSSPAIDLSSLPPSLMSAAERISGTGPRDPMAFAFAPQASNSGDLALRPLLRQEPQQVVAQHRLDEEHIEAGSERGGAVLHEGVRRQGDEPQGSPLQPRFLAAQSPGDLVAVEPRHAD